MYLLIPGRIHLWLILTTGAEGLVETPVVSDVELSDVDSREKYRGFSTLGDGYTASVRSK